MHTHCYVSRWRNIIPHFARMQHTQERTRKIPCTCTDVCTEPAPGTVTLRSPLWESTSTGTGRSASHELADTGHRIWRDVSVRIGMQYGLNECDDGSYYWVWKLGLYSIMYLVYPGVSQTNIQCVVCRPTVPVLNCRTERVWNSIKVDQTRSNILTMIL